MNETGTALRKWFTTAARDLPWRGPFPRDPYLVLVAEVMLQQTQVSRVIGVYTTFLSRFPTLEHLARAEQDEVLAAFGGLGYYRRARSLHAAAKALARAGCWPRRASELVRLPGMGPYTAAALAAFAFGGDEPPVDGNVMRVAARLQASEHPAGSRGLMGQARTLALDLAGRPPLPETWEALMELGATVCTPLRPACPTCPVRGYCAAVLSEAPERFPASRPSRPVERHTWAALWAERPDGRILVRLREHGPVLRGLWLPPIAELGDGPDEGSDDERVALLPFPTPGVSVRRLPAFEHAITYRRIRIIPYRVTLASDTPDELSPGWRWEHPGDVVGRTSSLLVKLHRAVVQGDAS